MRVSLRLTVKRRLFRVAESFVQSSGSRPSVCTWQLLIPGLVICKAVFGEICAADELGRRQAGPSNMLSGQAELSFRKVSRAGVEPATFAFGGRRSIQLSYRDSFLIVESADTSVEAVRMGATCAPKILLEFHSLKPADH